MERGRGGGGEGKGKGYRFTESRAEVASIYVSLSLNSLACRRHGQCPAMRTLVRLRDVVITVSRLLTQVATDHLGGMGAKNTAMAVVCVPGIPPPISITRVLIWAYGALGDATSSLCAC